MPKQKDRPDDKDLPISDYVSSLVASVVAKSRSLARVDHTGIKGHFNEVLFRELLSPFLPSFLRITSGKVIVRRLTNRSGYKQLLSSQQDAIVYDSRLLPPFIEMQGVGYVPIEAAVATVEVKYRKTLDKATVEEALKGQDEVGRLLARCRYCALHAVLLLGDSSNSIDLKNLLPAVKWVQFLCIPGASCWKRLRNRWTSEVDSEDGSFEGTKGFIATFVDNCRTFAERRYRILTRVRRGHHDWLSHYIRTQRRESNPAK